MTTPSEFNRQLAAAARDMAGEHSTQDTLDRAVGLAIDLIEGCDIAGVSVVHKTRIDTPAATDETVRLIDETQFAMQQGPCLDALREHETVASNDLGSDERWPEWGPRMAQEAHVKCCLCFQLFTAGEALGALNLYSYHTHGFTVADVDNGLALAAQVAIALAAAQHEEQLEVEMDNRTVIGQAQGILMERFDLEPDTAFRVLARFSSSLNIKVHDVARQIVATGHLPDRDLN
jgi:GAF domain-containing protein